MDHIVVATSCENVPHDFEIFLKTKVSRPHDMVERKKLKKVEINFRVGGFFSG
jgi:hypothetical protein